MASAQRALHRHLASPQFTVSTTGFFSKGEIMHETPQPHPQHKWLDRLVGSWTYEGEMNMGPDQPPMKWTGKETVRTLGGLWFLGEMEGQMSTNIMSLGYDPAQSRYVGTFISAMGTHMWIYSGELDPSGKKLVLNAKGPNFSQSAMANYQDIIQFVDGDHRTLTSQMEDENGKWQLFMTVHYQRVK
jgi:hypothetical protein